MILEFPLTLAMARFLTFIGLLVLLVSGFYGLYNCYRYKRRVIPYLVRRLYLLPAAALFSYYFRLMYTNQADFVATRTDLIYLNLWVGALVFAISLSNAYTTAQSHRQSTGQHRRCTDLT